MLTANMFALMGLRQLYFLIGGLLERLVYLSYGLAVLLGFIGVKLILHAMHENELPFINGGEHIEWAPDIPIWLSLVVIVGILAVTAVASLSPAGPGDRAGGHRRRPPKRWSTEPTAQTQREARNRPADASADRGLPPARRPRSDPRHGSRAHGAYAAGR